MRFGIYCEIQTPPGKAHSEMIWEIMRQIEHADDAGFDVYSVIDHHFFQKFSISANPLAMFAAAAQRTKRIRFRTALHALPEQLREHTVLPLLHYLPDYDQLHMPLAGALASAERFHAAVQEAKIGPDKDIPHVTPQVIVKYIDNLRRIGLV